jgi:hypothetical protein
MTDDDRPGEPPLAGTEAEQFIGAARERRAWQAGLPGVRRMPEVPTFA